MHNIANGWVWLGFSIFIVIALSLDTFFFSKKTVRPHESMRAAIVWTCVWIVCALIFNVLLWVYLDATADRALANEVSLNFFTGYLIEKSLSVDNLFVFYMIFSHFKIPLTHQQRAFSYGIWSAIILRLVIILLGVWLIAKFHWLLYVMGAFLFFTGIKMFFADDKEKDLTETWILRAIRRFFRVTKELHGESFFIRKEGLLFATPLFITLVFIEFSDIVFAMDSIPAIFAITRDPFIVWSSNIFAILGLRALYFLLAGAVEKLRLLKYGIALILIYVGIKMLVAPWFTIPVEFSLGVIVGILLLFILVSLKLDKRQ